MQCVMVVFFPEPSVIGSARDYFESFPFFIMHADGRQRAEANDFIPVLSQPVNNFFHKKLRF